jgi:hypothetical protein
LGITGAAGETQTNFISLSNTHPTKAVTIHFRYFNDECEDVLDFLVILTCNDTLLFNPFDFQIPAASLGEVRLTPRAGSLVRICPMRFRRSRETRSPVDVS